MWVRLTDLYLSENVWCNAIVEFDCSSPGCSGDYWTEPEGPEFEVKEFYVEEAWGGSINDSWEKGRDDLGDWVGILDDLLNKNYDPTYDNYDELYAEYHDYGDY